jgi:hypothetical protein
VKDISGFKNNAVLNLSTTPKWVLEGRLGLGCYKFGNENRTVGYNDINQNIVSSNFATGKQFTASAWIKHNSLDTNYKWPIMALSEDDYLASASTGQALLCIESNRFRVHFWGGSDAIVATLSNDNQWHHIVATYDYDTRLLNMYLDGVKEVDNFNTAETGVAVNPNNRWQIGCNLRAYPYNETSGYKTTFEGNIDDPRVYATILSDSDIKKLYENRMSLDSKGNLYINNIKEGIQL